MDDDVEKAQLFDDAEASLRIGSYIKVQRQKRGWTLEHLSGLCGVSIGAISKIEKGQTRPVFDTVLRIARALKISFVEMMDGPDGKPNSNGRLTATKLGEAQEFNTAEYVYQVHSAGLMHKVMIPLHIKIKGSSQPPLDEWTTHDGEKFIFVIVGSVKILTEQYAPITLKQGESCYFDSTMRHCMVSAVDGPSEVVSVCLSRQPFEDMHQEEPIARAPRIQRVPA